MNLFAISDLHLSLKSEKPMDIFRGWENYTEKIISNWKKTVTDNDTVVIPGDISWGSTLEESKADFELLNSLPGKKIILKGNHDFWWTTIKKINEFFTENGFDTLSVLHNDYKKLGEYAVCGSRGWLYDGSGEQDKKVIARECGRLNKSISDALRDGFKPIVFMHYPPAYGEFVCEEIFSVLKGYGITDVYYGHIHGSGFNKSLKEYSGVALHLVSCDCVDFTPVFLGKY